MRGPERENGCYVTMHPATSLQHCLRIAEESGCGKHILKVKKNHDSCAGMGSQERVGTKDSPKDPLVEREVPCSASHARPATIERGLPSARHEGIASNMFRFCS